MAGDGQGDQGVDHADGPHQGAGDGVQLQVAGFGQQEGGKPFAHQAVQVQPVGGPGAELAVAAAGDAEKHFHDGVGAHQQGGPG